MRNINAISDALLGREFTRFERTEDYWTLFFVDASMVVNNPMHWATTRATFDESSVSVKQVEMVGKDLSLLFDNGWSIKIDLSDDAYRTPEGIVITLGTGEIVVG